MELNVEVKNFYPVERNDAKGFLKGGLHIVIKFADFEVNIRGILVSKKKQKCFIRMPFRNGKCHKTGTSVEYPIFVFSNQEHNKALLDAIYKQTPSFIESFLASNPQPIIQESPPIQKKPKGKVITSKDKNNATEAKLSSSFTMLQPSQYMDVPPRKTKKVAYAKR